MDNNVENQSDVNSAQNQNAQNQVPPQNQQGGAGQPVQQFTQQVGSQMGDFAKNKDLLEKVGLICAGAGFAISFIFTIISCSKSASNSISVSGFKGSYLFIVVLVGMLVSIAGGVMAFMSKRGEDFSNMAKLTFLVVIVTLVFGIIPNITICAYNNSLNNASEKYVKDAIKDYSSLFD